MQGLAQVMQEFEADVFTLQPGDEDIHTAVERRLTEIVGPLGGKLHTGRSRNDQVATDFAVVHGRLRARGVSNCGTCSCAGRAGQESAGRADPGYTHMQPAQPIVLAHWLLSFFWMLQRDRERLAVARNNAAVLPLGSGALAGTPLAVDRAAMARELGFAAVSHNSLDSVSDRDLCGRDPVRAGADGHPS